LTVRWLLLPLCLLWQSVLAQTDALAGMASAYWLALDGQALWAGQAAQRLPPASLTKMMTALLVLEQADWQQPVTVSAAAARETGSRIGLRSGDVAQAHDLLMATLMASANDACHALAAHLAGNQARFVEQMNARARALGLKDTHFANACGHDAPAHYASAQDLGRLAQALLRHPQVLPITSQLQAQMLVQPGARRLLLKNTNALIGRYPGALGLKTGYTRRAGRCLVALAQRNGNSVLLVLLNGRDRWWDAVDALDLAFARAGG